MGRHTAQPEGRANLTKVAGLAGMATAAAALAMSVGAGTAQAKPFDINKILNPKSNTSSDGAASAAKTASANKLSSSNNPGSFLSSIAPSIYNPGPFTIGPVTDPAPGPIVKPPSPSTGKPFAQITGIQLPIWTVNNGKPVTPF